MYQFNKLDDVINMCSIITDVDYKVYSSLYKMDGRYYIVYSKENNVFTLYSVVEFGGVEVSSNDLIESYYKEHAEIYILKTMFLKN